MKITSRFFWSIRSRSQEAEKTVITTNTLQSGNFLIAILVEEIKCVVAVKDEFAFRDESKVIEYFGNFGLSRF